MPMCLGSVHWTAASSSAGLRSLEFRERLFRDRPSRWRRPPTVLALVHRVLTLCLLVPLLPDAESSEELRSLADAGTAPPLVDGGCIAAVIAGQSGAVFSLSAWARPVSFFAVYFLPTTMPGVPTACIKSSWARPLGFGRAFDIVRSVSLDVDKHNSQ